MKVDNSNILEIIGLESVVEADMQNLITSFFPILGDKLRNAYHELLNVGPMEKVSGDASRAVSLVNKHAYLDIASFPFAVPESLKVKYLEYLNSVLACSAWGSRVIERDLNPAIKEMSTITSVNIARFDTNNIKASEKDSKLMMVLKRDMVDMFDKSFTHKRSFGDLFDRSKDFTDAMQLFKAIEQQPMPGAKEVLAKVERVSVLFDSIIAMSKEGKLQGISAPVLKQLSQRAYELADQVTFYTFASYHRREAATALSVALKQVIKVLS